MTKIRDKEYLKALGDRMRGVRIKKGMSIFELSYMSNVSRSQINSIEKGDINTTVCTIKAISDALEIDAKDILDF